MRPLQASIRKSRIRAAIDPKAVEASRKVGDREAVALGRAAIALRAVLGAAGHGAAQDGARAAGDARGAGESALGAAHGAVPVEAATEAMTDIGMAAAVGLVLVLQRTSLAACGNRRPEI
mmetsp:Transcript_17872/g.32841  ORF Transcript_17872/g.32841 Transcript_17872/m.32841 type:complete len:120 (-) Transcript_17872:67-426(-)